MKISYHGRWEKQLKIAKERFLNYFNARLEENCLSFSFTAKELEIIAVGRVEGNNDEAYAEGEIEGKRALNAQYIEE